MLKLNIFVSVNSYKKPKNNTSFESRIIQTLLLRPPATSYSAPFTTSIQADWKKKMNSHFIPLTFGDLLLVVKNVSYVP